MWPKPSNAMKVKLKAPHREQRRFIDSPAKRKIIRAGRRGGKTVGVSILAVKRFLEGQRILYIGPTEPQTTVFWNEVRTALTPLVNEGLFTKSETERTIAKPGSLAQICCKTGWDPDALRSDFCDLAILDEAQLQTPRVWDEVVIPMLLDRDGVGIVVYTPPSFPRQASGAGDPRWVQKLFKAAEQDRSGRWETFHFTSHANPYINRAALREITKGMTRLGYRREVEAEDLAEIPGALWKLADIEPYRVQPQHVPDLEVVFIGVDPPGSDKTECGIVAAGRGRPPLGQTDDGRKHLYILQDESMLAPTSRAWAQRAVNLYYERKADRLLGERNYGGDMVEGTIRLMDGGQNVAYQDANATRGKVVRAQPVAAAYQRGLVHHVGVFPELEEEMCSYVEGNKSPNRMDAMVWCGLRLLEGMGVYGLLDYFESGAAAAELAQLESTPRPAPAPVTRQLPTIPAASAPVCPECKSKMTIPVAGGQRRCNECGSQWWPAGQRPTVVYAGFAGGMPGIFER